MCGAVRVQADCGFVLFTGSRNIQMLRRVVVELRQEEVVVRVVRIVFRRALINRGIGWSLASDPGGKEQPPRPVDQSTARDQDEYDCNEFTRPGIQSNFP